MSDGNLCLVLSEDGESQGNEAQAPSTHAGAVVFHLSKLTADQFTVKEANKPVQCQIAALRCLCLAYPFTSCTRRLSPCRHLSLCLTEVSSSNSFLRRRQSSDAPPAIPVKAAAARPATSPADSPRPDDKLIPAVAGNSASPTPVSPFPACQHVAPLAC